MSESRRDLIIASDVVSAAPTVASVVITVPVGHSWEIIHAAVLHDDPAGLTGLLWGIRVNGVTFYVSATETLAIGIRSMFYDRYKGRSNVILHGGQSLYVLSSAPAATKRLTMEYIVEVRKGEMAGDNV